MSAEPNTKPFLVFRDQHLEVGLGAGGKLGRPPLLVPGGNGTSACGAREEKQRGLGPLEGTRRRSLSLQPRPQDCPTVMLPCLPGKDTSGLSIPVPACAGHQERDKQDRPLSQAAHNLVGGQTLRPCQPLTTWGEACPRDTVSRGRCTEERLTVCRAPLARTPEGGPDSRNSGMVSATGESHRL